MHDDADLSGNSSKKDDVQSDDQAGIFRKLLILTIAVLLLSSVYLAIRLKNRPAVSAALTIEVTASPEGAEIFIDGESAGISTDRKSVV